MTCPPGRRSGRVREPVAQSRRTRIVVGPSAMFRPVLGRRGPAPPRRGTAAENPPPSPGPFPDPAARTPRCTARIQAASTMTRTTSPRPSCSIRWTCPPPTTPSNWHAAPPWHGPAHPTAFSGGVPGPRGPHAPIHSPDTGRLDDDKDHEPEAELFDPVDLPTPDDPFELARRTINRSRAAARDRGLFPISAKTQARDVRDRSRGAPGYSGARPDPRDPQGIGLILRRVLSDLGWNAGRSEEHTSEL